MRFNHGAKFYLALFLFSLFFFDSDYELGTCITSHRYHLDEPRTVAMHPSGHQIIVGFKDKMIMYHVLVDRLKSFREMPCKVCHEVKFAPLGQYFAAVLGNGISIFATYQKDKSSSSFLLLQSFTGHVGLIKDLSWANDNILFTAGIDKNIYGWDVQRGARIDNLNILRTFGNCDALVVFSSKKKFEAAACTSDGAIHRIHWIGISTAASELKTLTTGSGENAEDKPVSICFNEEKTVLYVGTSNGVVRCFNWTTEEEAERMTCFREVSIHARHPDSQKPAITCLRTAGSCLITAGGIDGSLVLSSTGKPRDSKLQLSVVPTFQNDNVVLITLEDFKQSKDLVTELEQKIISLINDHEFALHSKDMLWRNEIKELTERTNEIVGAEQ